MLVLLRGSNAPVAPHGIDRVTLDYASYERCFLREFSRRVCVVTTTMARSDRNLCDRSAGRVITYAFEYSLMLACHGVRTARGSNIPSRP